MGNIFVHIIVTRLGWSLWEQLKRQIDEEVDVPIVLGIFARTQMAGGPFSPCALSGLRWVCGLVDWGKISYEPKQSKTDDLSLSEARRNHSEACWGMIMCKDDWIVIVFVLLWYLIGLMWIGLAFKDLTVCYAAVILLIPVVFCLWKATRND